MTADQVFLLPGPTTHNARAYEYFLRGGNFERQAAMQASDTAMQIEPDHAQSHLARGYAHLASSQFEPAQQDFLRVAELAAQKFEAYYQLGRLAQHQGDTSGAIEYFTRAMELNPDDYESPLLENSISSISWIEHDPELDPLRDHPRYKALIVSLRLRESLNQT